MSQDESPSIDVNAEIAVESAEQFREGPSKPKLIEVTSDTPRSVAARMAMLTMNDIGQAAQMLPAALAGRDDDWVRNFANLVLAIHETITMQMTSAIVEDRSDWKNTVGETFEESVRKGRVPGARQIVQRQQTRVNISPSGV